MAELHKFRDDVKTEAGRAKPLMSRHMDENFTTVRLKLASRFNAVFEIKQSPGKSDELDLAAGAPTSGTWVLAIVDGTVAWVETEEC